MSKEKKLILIDGHALAYRMFFALERTGMKTSTNIPTWAVYGFVKAILDILRKIKPDAIAVSFDMSRKTFRTEEFEEYKAQRAAMPDALKEQMKSIFEAVNALNIPIYQMENFEADDIIGTIATNAKKMNNKVYILTGDQDSFQLIDKDGYINILIPQKNELVEYNWEKVYEKLCVYPNQIVDYKALRGDVSDNIPGVKGIGEKTAAKLLNDYKTLDNIYENIANILPKGVKEKLVNDKKMAYKSQFLASIKKDVEIDFDFEVAKLNIPNINSLREFFTKYEFHSFLRNIDNIVAIFNGQEANYITQEKIEIKSNDNEINQLNLFSSVTYNHDNEIKLKKCFSKNLIDTKDKLDKLFLELSKQKVFGFILALTGVEMMSSSFCGIAFSYADGFSIENSRLQFKNNNTEVKTAYVPIINAGKSYFNPQELYIKLKSIFENVNIAKITQNAKLITHILKNNDIELKNVIFDTMLADYIKDPALKHGIKQQALSYLKFDMKDATELLGKGKNAKTMSELSLEILFDYFSDDVYALLELTKYHVQNFNKKEENLFYEIELPLTSILYEMERNGVSLDIEYLRNLSLTIQTDILKLESKIYSLAGVEFNINSPKQVGDILFEHLGIKPKGKNKTKTGYSTSSEVLEELSQEYEIAKLILEYRHLSKIKATFVDTLPELVCSIDNRLHTTFNQTITTTGRLSSSNPNLQNIPARTQIGNEIRGAFIPEKQNYVIMAADYSQIELRLLAHYSKDLTLSDAFIKNADIHSATAAKIFNVPISEVTKDMRRKAKAVNFGIIYGQTRYGLAEVLSVSPKEAQEFIDIYFETYPKICEYMEMTKIFAIENSYVETLYGRKRYFLNELNSSNRMIREFAQRAAINAPLQGTAADLIKLAMINLHESLKKAGLNAKMILQVHDELILEVPENEIEQTAKIMLSSMELNQPLDVPLLVDLSYGRNWKDAKNNEFIKI